MERSRTAAEFVSDYRRLFVNRGAYTLQSLRPHPVSGRYYYYRPKQTTLGLDAATICRHLEGAITIGLYAVNPETQRSKWIAIDADYDRALEDLVKLQYNLQQEEVDSALEMSRRGGHLWIFMEEPVLARECRIYIHDVVTRLGLRVKASGPEDGVEIFPKQDEVRAGEFGSAMRGPLGIHRAARQRYWFCGAGHELENQMAYLNRLRKMNEHQLRRAIGAKALPTESASRRRGGPAGPIFRGKGKEFRILDHLGKVRTVGRNYVGRCPSCAKAGRDRSGDNLSISVDDPRKYRCWAGCSKEMIRQALGFPIAEAYSTQSKTLSETNGS